MLGADLRKLSIISKISVLELSRKFVRSALSVGSSLQQSFLISSAIVAPQVLEQSLFLFSIPFLHMVIALCPPPVSSYPEEQKH